MTNSTTERKRPEMGLAAIRLGKEAEMVKEAEMPGQAADEWLETPQPPRCCVSNSSYFPSHPTTPSQLKDLLVLQADGA